ncbi:hypothetical protein SHKM778_32780 [Streptomyces sp. KM77-8]|uniref:Carrier domain-containing protein n=1 Tax=Streptomyces haneummycinicus TaxID=3074435 RepID=A0AAT9HHU3_9ACTN
MARPRPLVDAVPEARAAREAGPAQGSTGRDTGADFAERLKELPEAQHGRAVLDLVRTHVAALLGYDDPATLDPARPFTDLGFDSVAATSLVQVLSAASGQHLSATLVFDHATLAALAAHLHGELCPRGAGVGAGGVLAVLADLDRLEEALAALPSEDIERHRLPGRFQALTARLTGGGTGPSPDEQLAEDASADDVLAFIDKELGLA